MSEHENASATGRKTLVVLRPARSQPTVAAEIPGWLARRGFSPRVKMQIASKMSAGKAGSRPRERSAASDVVPLPDNIVQLRSYRRSTAA